MAKRLKSGDNFVVIKNWEEADLAVKTIGELQAKITELEAATDIVVNQAKADLAATTKPLADTIIANLDAVEHFAEEHKDGFGVNKSRQLNFGIIGWRKSTALKIANVKKTIELIKEKFASKAKLYLHLKDTPDKEALAKLTDEELASVAARRKSTDDFYVEPDLTKAANYQERSE